MKKLTQKQIDTLAHEVYEQLLNSPTGEDLEDIKDLNKVFAKVKKIMFEKV